MSDSPWPTTDKPYITSGSMQEPDEKDCVRLVIPARLKGTELRMQLMQVAISNGWWVIDEGAAKNTYIKILPGDEDEQI